MNDGTIGLLLGLFIGGTPGSFFTALAVTAGYKDSKWRLNGERRPWKR